MSGHREPFTRKDAETIAGYLAGFAGYGLAMWWWGAGEVIGFVLAIALLVAIIGIPIQCAVWALSGHR